MIVVLHNRLSLSSKPRDSIIFWMISYVLLPQHSILHDLFTWKRSMCSNNSGTHCRWHTFIQIYIMHSLVPVFKICVILNPYLQMGSIWISKSQLQWACMQREVRFHPGNRIPSGAQLGIPLIGFLCIWYSQDDFVSIWSTRIFLTFQIHFPTTGISAFRIFVSKKEFQYSLWASVLQFAI